MGSEPAARRRRPARAVLRRTWRGLLRMRTALWLLGGLALAATLATFVPQEPVTPSTVAAWRAGTEGPGPTTVWLLDAAGLFDVVGAWWTTALLGLLLVSLTGCLALRVRAFARVLRHPPDPTRPTGLEQHAVVPSDEPVAALDAAATWLRAHGYRAARDGHVVGAERGRWHEAGSIAMHASLYLLLVGAVLTQVGGFTAQVDVAEGRSFSETPLAYDVLDSGRLFDEADHRGFLVTLQGFALRTHPDGSAADYVATVAIAPQPSVGGAGDVVTAGPRVERLRINHPARQDGVVLHLVRYGVAPELVVRDVDGRELLRDAVRLQGAGAGAWEGAAVLRRGTPDGEGQLALDVAVLPSLGAGEPDVVDPRAGSSVALPVDPLVVVDLHAGDLGLEPTLDAPARPVLGGDRVVGRAELRAGGPPVALGSGHTVELVRVGSWAGLQVRRAPGLGLLCAGGLLLLGGLAVSSTTHRRRLVVRADHGAVVVLGRAWQRPELVAAELEALTAALVDAVALAPRGVTSGRGSTA